MCNWFSQLTHVGEEVSLIMTHAQSRILRKTFLNVPKGKINIANQIYKGKTKW